MKSIKKLVTGLAVAGSAWYWSTAAVFAENANLCPEQFSSLCNTGISVSSIVRFAINGLLFVGFVASLIFLIYGGIRWIISGGDKENTAKAKATVTAALIGLVIVLAAWIIMNAVVQIFTNTGFTNLNVPTLK